MSLKITTLIENMPDKEEKLAYEHGFSVFVETEGKKILFDTGQTGAFVKNAVALGIDLEAVDMVVLSHGHYDHTGGVPALLEVFQKKVPFYIGKEFFLPKYKQLEDGSYKYNGNPFQPELLTGETATGKECRAEVHMVDADITRLGENLLLFKNFAWVTEYEKVNPKFFVKKESGYEQDLFPDEIALGILTKQGLVLVTGCSHVGIVNLLEHVKRTLDVPVAAVLGGTHLVEAGEERLWKTAGAFQRYGIKKIAVSHCTGEAGAEFLKKEFPERYELNNTGNVMIL